MRKTSRAWVQQAVVLGLFAVAGLAAAAVGHLRAADEPLPIPEYGKLIGRTPPNSIRETERYLAMLKAYGKKYHVRVRTGYWEAYLWRMRQLAYPNDFVDWDAWKRAAEHRDRMPGASLAALKAGGIHTAAGPLPQRWEFIGPNKLAVPYRIYYGQGSTTGRVNALAYDPATPTTYWLAGASGGVFKSTNAGVSWQSQSGSWPFLETSSLAIDPASPNTVYAGTGDFQGSGGYPFGIMKTTDGGATWTNQGKALFGDSSISKVLVDPETPATVTITTGRGRRFQQGKVWRSTNGGGNWTPVINQGADWSGATIGAKTGGGARHYWVCGEDTGGEVWRSDDRGGSWTKLTSPLGSGFQQGVDIAASKTAPDTVYLLSGSDRKIYKSTDAGGTWTDISAGFPNDDQSGDNYNWSQSSYDYQITTSTRTSGGSAVDVIYVGLIDVAQSPDAGATWKSVGLTYTGNALTHNDQHSMAINPANPDEALVGNDGGVYRLNFNTGANSVTFDTTLSASVGISQFYHADWHPTDPTRMIGGTQDNATPVALGNLGNWSNVCGGDGGGCAINPFNPNIQFASTQFLDVCRTGNQWQSVQQINPPFNGSDNVPFIGQMIADPTSGDRMYAASNFLYRWSETSQGWTAKLGGNPLASGNGFITQIAVAPSDGNIIYTGSSNGEVYMTVDGGGTWTQINTGSPALPNRSIGAIVVHPTFPNNVLVGLAGTGTAHLFRCTDTSAASRVWTNVSGSGLTGLPDVPVNTAVVDPGSPLNKFYVGTDVGVFRTSTTGQTWENATAPLGLPNVQVNTLKIPATGYLMAATYGRGMWRIDPNAKVLGINVASPNGGEFAIVNKSYPITWSSVGFPQGHTVKIELSRNGGSTYLPGDLIAASAPDTGQFDWVPTGPTGSQCRIKITSNIDTTAFDTSDSNFSIVDGSLTVTGPNGGEVGRIGKTVSITWNTTGFASSSQQVLIELSRDGGASFPEVLFAATANDGQQDWVVTGPVTAQARVRVTALNAPTFNDASDADFAIRDVATLKVLTPNGGESIVVGQNMDITWQSQGLGGSVRIDRSNNGGVDWTTLYPSVPNDGVQPYVVAGPATNSGRIRVVSLEDPTVSDFSDGVFHVEVPSLKVTGPKAGAKLLIGQNGLVTWTSTGMSPNDPVNVDLSVDGGGTFSSIGAGVPNTGSLGFSVGGPATNSAVVRVTNASVPGVFSLSETFQIVTPTLFVASPNGGNTWKLGTQEIIQWTGTSVGAGTVTVELSRNGGASFETLATAAPNNGAIAYGVKGKPTKKALVRVTWNDDPSRTDISDKAFKIVAKGK